MKNIIVATVENETNLYNYSKAVLNELKKNNFPFVVLGKLTGKTYKEKAAEVTQKAIDYQGVDVGGLSYGEHAEICAYFETYGKRYGLLKELRENAII